ncbi:MAG: class I SAM-dependent methyltransferase, partial [Actinomycetota bacterium]|nr:class I SAM-dependent methyltransferase [Actinomycetota bacterium]
ASPPMSARPGNIAQSWLKRRFGRLLDGYLEQRAQRDREESRARHAELIGWLAEFERRQRRDVYTAMERIAADQSAEFALEAFRFARPCFSPHETLRHAIEQSPPTGLALEFGVASGRTLAILAETRGQRKVFGFDSFDGLPEHWRWGFDVGSFAADKAPVVQGAEIIEGLFQDVLPVFLANNAGQLSIAHIDSDLYSSARYVLQQLRPRMVEGTVILFDEYYNFPGWREHEHRAWQEFVAESGLEFEYLGATADDEQVSVRITAPPKPSA